MLRTRLLAATAAVALFAAPAALAQDVPAPDQTAPETGPETGPEMGPETAVPPTPPATASPQAQAQTQVQAGTEVAEADNVVEVLRAQGRFSTLLAALEQAQLIDTLSTRPAISIFAPTDAAFAALPEAERARLMDPANAQELRQLLLYHVIVADVASDQIRGARGPVETAARTQVQLDGVGDAIKVDEATVVQADIDASNGAVFAIDRVLNPAASRAAMGDAEAPAEAATDRPGAETPPADAPVAPPVDQPPAAAMETPAPAGLNAPDGRPAETVTTTASPPVPHPTDGQVDSGAPQEPRTTPPTAPEEDTGPIPPNRF